MWITKSPLQTARSHPAAVSSKDKIYVFGGGGAKFLSLDTVEIYDPQSDIWSWGRPMPTYRSGAVAAMVGNKIYVIGGGYKKPDGKFKFLTTVELYYPDRDIWEKGPDMIMPHDYPGVAVLGDTIYIMGGHHPDATEGGPSKDPGFAFCEMLNVEEGRWVEIAELSVPRFALKGAVLDVYNPPSPLRLLSGQAYPSPKKIIATGGVAFTGNGLTEYDLIDIYDPVSNTWNREESFSLPWPAAAHGLCLHKGRLCIFGGYSTDGIHTRAVCYNEDAKEWARMPDIDKPRAAMGVASVNDSIYLVGGWEVDGRTVMDTVAAYAP